MYASIADHIPAGEGWTFEPKYDGIRVLAFATPSSVQLVTRNERDKAMQFPELIDPLRKLAARRRGALLLDGEIVAIAKGQPARFQQLQARMHLKNLAEIARHAEQFPAAFIAFDILSDGDESLLDDVWSVRRRRLEQRLRNRTSAHLRLGETVPNGGEAILKRAREKGWEGVIAKRMDSRYQPGRRSHAWLKLKVEHRQELVVGGYTEPRNSRQHIGALLLGYFENGRLVYAGHTGGGFTRTGLAEMHRRLAPFERSTSPFTTVPRTNERAHWVRPVVVVEVKFSEWTEDGKLRQPIFLGVRDDKDARGVGREPESMQRTPSRSPNQGARRARRRAVDGSAASDDAVVAALEKIEAEGGDGMLRIGRSTELELSSLSKVFFPKQGYTKGDVMRYYARIAPFILPTMSERPLVLKRYPNGVTGKWFYQQNAPDEVPEGVRTEEIVDEDGERPRRFVGGNLATLLYTVQLGTIAVDPWHARVRSLEYPDYTVLDLDPGPRAKFSRVIDVARWVKEALDSMGLCAALKTSGASGLHIYVPLPPKTPEEAALLIAQIVATRVADAHPREATIERAVKARASGTVYVDYLQNIRGKTLAGAYCIRARDGATVSTPLDWAELTPDLDPRDFTIESVPARIAEVGDRWAAGMVKNTRRTLYEMLPKELRER